MKTFTFSGETPAEALKKARDALGDDAMIIQTKEVRKKTLNQAGLYELVVGVNDDVILPSEAELTPQNPHFLENKNDETDIKSLPKNSIKRRLSEIEEREFAEKKRQKNLSKMLDDDVTIQLSDAVREIREVMGTPSPVNRTNPTKRRGRKSEKLILPETSQIELREDDEENLATYPQNPYQIEAQNLASLDSTINPNTQANTRFTNDEEWEYGFDELDNEFSKANAYTQARAYNSLESIKDINNATPQQFTPKKIPQNAANTSNKEALKSALKKIKNAKDALDVASAQSQQANSQASLESSAFKEIYSELKSLNDKIKLIQNTLWEEKRPNMAIEVPKEFAEIYRIAKASGMNKEHIEEIMRLSTEFMPLKMRSQSATIKRYFREVMRKMIYCRKENSVGKKIIIFVGPTGVGKTTTIAKLAARFSQILPQKKKVGLITLDDYRIGAQEQLAWYARKMRISIDSASDVSDFLSKIEAIRYCDYIFIDTAGHSQYDKQKINALKKFVKNDEYKIDVSLVLSASTKYEDLKDTYLAFSELEIDTFIFSKLDEARGLGNIFSLVYETKKPISYLCVGQEVPSDVIVADNNYLADCLMGGFFYPDKETK